MRTFRSSSSRQKKIVGHFAAVMLLVSINGQVYNFRMSMGFMTDACYRGNGIATNLYKKLKQEIIAEGKALFIIGFPNDVSVKMHLTKMEYSLCREFQFVKLPYKKQSRKFRKINIEEIGNKKIIRHPYNMVVHDSEYIKWRFNSQKYTSYVSDDKKYFICTKFKNKVDLLYWDSTVDEKDILELAGFFI